MANLDMHDMQPSLFHIPEEALAVARRILDPSRTELYYKLRNEFMKCLPEGQNCVLDVDIEQMLSYGRDSVEKTLNRKSFLTVYDPGDDVVAVISRDEVLHKEDFAVLMHAAGMELTEENFNKVWCYFPDRIVPEASLRAVAEQAVQTAKANLHLSLDVIARQQYEKRTKLSLGQQIGAAASGIGTAPATPRNSGKAPAKTGR